MFRISDITRALEEFAPIPYQEAYDNSGLLCGDANWIAKGALFSLDCTEAVVDEAIQKGCNLIVAHHPLIFGGLKKLSGGSYVERALIKAIKQDIAIYACHTNIDNVAAGVNAKMTDKLGLVETQVLAPRSGDLRKLVTFVPTTHLSAVREALFAAGAGHIGKYSDCSFGAPGEGSFKGAADTQPFLGEPGKRSLEAEIRLETVFPSHLERGVLEALRSAHPYEEVALDVYRLENQWSQLGSGRIGLLPEALELNDFLSKVKEVFKVSVIKYTQGTGKPIKKVAVCGGSGRFLLKKAISAGADAYLTADFKYHEYFDAQDQLVLADIGHYESEQYTSEIFYDVIRKKFSTFAIHLSEINTNPVNYF
jgi:dinuclear metal center YbgI/SA1388 family protein